MLRSSGSPSSKAQEKPVDVATSAAARPSPVKDPAALLSALCTEAKPGTPLAAGMLLTPSVRLLYPLGDGGMASVWVAQHTNLGVQVAVKLLNESMQTLPAVYQRFLAEGPAAARIKSPHVIQILDRGVTPSGTPFIVMELLDGETVQQRLDRLGLLSLDDVRSILTQTARALSKAHAAGLAHCDVKPENIFLIDNDPDVFVKLLDFGIAKRFGEKDDSGIIFGTPQYMAPEQMVADGHIGVHTDVWSLAVVAYQMLTAGVPFGGETLEAVAAAVERGTFTPVTSLRHDVPVELDTWFERALSNNPVGRFESMREMVAAFDVACRGHAFKRAPAMSVHEFTFNGDRAALMLPPLGTDLSDPFPSAPPVTDSAPFDASLPTVPRRPHRWILPTLAAVALVGLGSLFTVVRAKEGTEIAHAGAAPAEQTVEVTTAAAAVEPTPAPAEVQPVKASVPTAKATTTAKPSTAPPKFRAAPPRSNPPRTPAKRAEPSKEEPAIDDIYTEEPADTSSATAPTPEPTPAPTSEAPTPPTESPSIL